MKEGKVKFFNYSKGFGFITPSDSDKDIFVHESGLIDRVKDDDLVEYNEEPGKKGMNAVEVRIKN